MNSIAYHPVTKPAFWVAPMMCSILFLGYIAVVFMNIPPFVRSDHVSVNWNMLFIAGLGAVASVISLAAVICFPIKKYIGRVSTGIIGVEAVATFILSIILLYKSFDFFGLV
jgi:hypothetical protein